MLFITFIKNKNMKKLITLLTILVTLTTNAQWMRESNFFIDFGPKGMIGPSLLNSNVTFDTTTSNYKHQLNSNRINYGFKLALNFGQNFSVVGEYVFTNNKQNFKVDESIKQIKSKGFEIPILLRHNNENFGYIEGGLAIVKSKIITEDFINNQLEVTELYNTQRTGLIFGLGGYLFSVENFGVSAGLRFRYDIDNFVSDENVKSVNNPIFALDSEVEKSNPMAVMFVLEFNYDLGFAMARSACGDRRKVMFTSGRR
jgi:hypothetical protein